VVDGRSVAAIGDAVAELLAEPDRAASMGAAGREWVTCHWRWDTLAGRMADLLQA
jgi:phosphatidylinositol alpha-1,6-mannosyltransferase